MKRMMEPILNGMARNKRLSILGAILLFIPTALVFAKPQDQKPRTQTELQSQSQKQEIPKLDAGIGACRADFTVRDGANKPIYNAKINVVIRYGFMSMRKTELQVATNGDGKARITGLPEFIKKALAFHIKSGTVSKTVTDDPSTNCNATYDVVLTVH